MRKNKAMILARGSLSCHFPHYRDTVLGSTVIAAIWLHVSLLTHFHWRHDGTRSLDLVATESVYTSYIAGEVQLTSSVWLQNAVTSMHLTFYYNNTQQGIPGEHGDLHTKNTLSDFEYDKRSRVLSSFAI